MQKYKVIYKDWHIVVACPTYDKAKYAAYNTFTKVYPISFRDFFTGVSLVKRVADDEEADIVTYISEI